MDFTLLILAIILDFSIYLMVLISMNVEVGLTGVPNFGRVLAIAGGAFFTGAVPGRLLAYFLNIQGDYIQNNPYIVSEINNKLQHDLLLAIGILAFSLIFSGLIGALLGYLSSYPALKLKEDYLGIALLITGTSLVVVGINYPPLIGGTLGVEVPGVFPALLGSGRELYWRIAIVLLMFSLLMTLFYHFISESPLGRALRAVRENEDLAKVLGRDIATLRGEAMAMGGFMAGIAGSLYAFYVGSVYAQAYDNITWSFIPYMMLVLGGAGTSYGAIAGALTYATAFHIIDAYKQQLGSLLHFDPIWLQYMLLGMAITVILIARPTGIFEEKPKPLIRRISSK